MINGMGVMAQFALQKICGAHVSLGSWVAVWKVSAEVRLPYKTLRDRGHPRTYVECRYCCKSILGDLSEQY